MRRIRPDRPFCSSHDPRGRRLRAAFMCAALALALPHIALAAQAGRPDTTPYCGNEGIWIQILGGGGPELDDGQTAASYVVFEDDKARLVVDPGPGSASLFDRAGGRVEDLDAIVLTSTRAERSLELPAFLTGARLAERDRMLPILGPDGDDTHPDTVTLIDRLVGPTGAYPELADTLPPRATGRFRASPRNVPATGQRRWSDFGSPHLRLSSIPAYYGSIPALVWKAEIGGMTIVFAGDTNNQRANLTTFAAGADALIIHHSIPEGTRGALTEFHMTPGQIGKIAAAADVRMVILGQRLKRTRGRESLSTAAIEDNYQGPLIYANDLECWGL